tara:strand:+ start:1473 stop:2450 length:978 start_codon:yes stop_codon:yes gene_type:complete
MAEQVLQALRELIKVHLNEDFTPEEVIDSLDGVVEHLEGLVARHAPKKYSEDYISANVFSKANWLDVSAYAAYCKVNLQLGTEHLKLLINDMKESPQEELHVKIKDGFSFVHDTLHDLRGFANFLHQRVDKDYTFFDGGKNAYQETVNLFRFAQALYYSTCSPKNPLRVYHNESHAASAFVLRQALEAKFERMVGVTAWDKNGNEPRLKHGFHYEFAKENPKFFDFQSLNFELVKRVYDWCSYVVHNAIQPLAWQMPYAFKICRGLYESGDLGPNGGWSRYGGVRVLNVGEMQSSFAKYLLENYDHGRWCFYFKKPEAADFSTGA